MKKTLNPELSKAINQHAHVLAAQTFPTIRLALQEKAVSLLREGKALDETIRAIRTAGNRECTPTS